MEESLIWAAMFIAMVAIIFVAGNLMNDCLILDTSDWLEYICPDCRKTTMFCSNTEEMWCIHCSHAGPPK